MLNCFDAKTGNRLFEHRLPGGNCLASPIAGDGKIYVCSERGRITVLKAEDQPAVLSTSDLKERMMATPAIADGQIYVRTEKQLIAFRP